MTSRLVCPFGRFELLCSTNGTILQWTIDFPDGSGVDDLGDRSISANRPEVQSFVIGDSTVLNISTTSLSPLTSLLEINNTIVALNETRIDCRQSISEMFSIVITTIRSGKLVLLSSHTPYCTQYVHL